MLPSPKSQAQEVISSVEGEPSDQAQEPAPMNSISEPAAITDDLTLINAYGKSDVEDTSG